MFDMEVHEPALPSPVGRERSAEIVFLIAANAGVWTVTKDGVFYGDYLKEEHAEASAQCAVAAILGKGGRAKALPLAPLKSGQSIDQVSTTPVAVGCERPSRYPVPES